MSVARVRVVVVLLGSLYLASCADEGSGPTSLIVTDLYQNGLGISANASPIANANANGGNFGTPLSGGEEVPARASRAQGSAIFQLSHDGTELDYRLIVANIENVVQAHIHLAVAGVNGPIVVWLYPSTAVGPLAPSGGGRISGPIATGTITAANFTGPLLGDPMSDLVDALQSGGAYVNVHTNDGVAPTNTGPGDFPGGEVRGQIEHRGH
jgi:hypothetical protein